MIEQKCFSGNQRINASRELVTLTAYKYKVMVVGCSGDSGIVFACVEGLSSLFLSLAAAKGLDFFARLRK